MRGQISLSLSPYLPPSHSLPFLPPSLRRRPCTSPVLSLALSLFPHFYRVSCRDTTRRAARHRIEPPIDPSIDPSIDITYPARSVHVHHPRLRPTDRPPNRSGNGRVCCSPRAFEPTLLRHVRATLGVVPRCIYSARTPNGQPRTAAPIHPRGWCSTRGGKGSFFSFPTSGKGVGGRKKEKERGKESLSSEGSPLGVCFFCA